MTSGMTFCCDECDFTSDNEDDFLDLGGDRWWGGNYMAFPTVCNKHEEAQWRDGPVTKTAGPAPSVA